MSASSSSTGSAAQIAALLERVREAHVPDRELDCDIARWSGFMGHAAGLPNEAFIGPGVVLGPCGILPRYTGSIDAAVALVGQKLPGWAWSCGTCCVSNDGWLKPDVEGPASHLCDVFDEGFDGSTKGGNIPLAILEAMFQALIALEERAHAND